MKYQINNEFERKDATPTVRITDIITTGVTRTGKKTKLSDPIIHLEYTEPGRAMIRMYETDLDKLIFLERWKRIDRTDPVKNPGNVLNADSTTKTKQ